ncbi:MAG TPA: aminotransferase class V-fold PLP-dependent enzyme [Pirellulaceae bacterium]|nr:aminotransferase class V-fold PLP-dependent enzyme [Pirellulaceae bacterium]HMO92438.1 aminotransferase class V-fold PLP-dependent enzyme [Pirellulaceae bacterium]HMP67892.1 aminotransferase class V-fold PLP-dependent enzyme [Pirellulaceae bacterium]
MIELKPERIYLDNAATSWPKPPEVIQALADFYNDIGSSAGRGNSLKSLQAKEIIESTRALLTAFIGGGNAYQTIFTTNGTTALNQAILGLLKAGDHVITTQAEHNSVLRPLRHLEDQQVISVKRLEVDSNGQIGVESLRSAIQENTKLVIACHASNVTGAIQPIREICEVAQNAGVFTLIDAAQTVGHLPLNVAEIGCDMLAASGHKGLLGPLGTGFLCVRDELARLLTPLFFGGTGSTSELDTQPNEGPAKFESGNLNTAAIAGLAVGIKHNQVESVAEFQQRILPVCEYVLNELANIEGITCYGPLSPTQRVPVFSFNVDGLDAREASALLESGFGVETRGGLHCAPLIHQALQTNKSGGTVRMSLGRFNTESQVERAIEAVKQVAASNIF